MERMCVLFTVMILVLTVDPAAGFAQNQPTSTRVVQDAPVVQEVPVAPQPLDPRVSLTITIIGVVAAGAVLVTAMPYLLPILESGSYSILCVVSPVC